MKWIVVALMLLFSFPACADSPQQTVRQVMVDARAGQVAQLLPLLTPRSQQALAATWSHSSGLSEDAAWQSLQTNDPALATLWTVVVQALPAGPLHVSLLPNGSIVSVNGRNFPVIDGRVALLETVLPSWLNVQPATPVASDDDDVVVVGESPDMADISDMADQGIPTPPPDNSNQPTSSMHLSPGAVRFY